MQDFLIELVKNAGADAWEITDVENYGWEFYFIKHKLDQNRVKKTEHTSVKLFKKSEDGKFLGSAVSEIAPTASREEAQAILGKLLFQASLVKNPVYTLNEKKETEAEAAEFDVSKIAGNFIKAMQELPETETEYINSYEIFVNGEKRRFLNSNGIDVTAAYPSSMIEVVVNAKNEDHEIELYRMYTSGACDAEALKEKLGRTLTEGRDRLTTKKTPALGTATIALTTDAALEVYQYFANRMSCGYKYQGLSDYEIGEPVIKDAEGDALTVTARAFLPNSSGNCPFDPEGAPVRDLTIIKDTRAEHFWGSRQFASYLGVSDSFIAGNFEVAGGEKTSSELLSGDFLEIVEFSDFQVDAMTGSIAGEIRLGYLHRGGEVMIVSGGSVSGNMHEAGRGLHFSKETVQYDNYIIPAVTILTLTVTGA
ncbi:MAG: metallopeptidase TldD-related protein [Lachnospiraceae bacterium]|nr:metallopeptidase TldD-related protein [Lachnospiraceae bacterium]